MKSKTYKVLLSLVLTLVISLAGCSETESDPTEPTQQSSATEETREEVSDNRKDATETVLGDNGSISITSTDSEGNVVAQIVYNAGTNITEKYIYEYDEKGNLIREQNYMADGNVVNEFTADNYENANSFGEINYDIPGDYADEIDEAFSVTIEELAPLYEKAEQIWVTYGVAVLIADKVSDYTDGAELCFEYNKINSCLNLVESCLSCYPTDFFRDFSGNVCIQLVGTGSSAGLYMGGYEQLLLQMDVNCYSPEGGYDDEGGFFCYTLHHEIAHMISETLMERAEWSQCPLTEERWNSYNPEGFAYVNGYDDEKEMEIYDSGNNYEYFLFSYGCSTPDEDRAMIFGEAMVYYQGYESTVFTDPVKAKLKYFGDCIRAGFISSNWGEMAPWEHILQREN